MIVGKTIGGSVGDKILIRLKSNSNVDVGDLLKIDTNKERFYLKVINKSISSSIPNQFIEEMAGQSLEYNERLVIFDKEQRFYQIAEAKMLKIKRDRFIPPRTIPPQFSDVETISKDDFKFLEERDGVKIGYLRSGTHYVEDVVIKMPINKLISHHILITAATGKGKSNFAKVFISGLLDIENTAAVIIDPHAEYYGGKGNKGLSSHPNSDRIEYFTPIGEEIGCNVLKVYSEDLMPNDFHGIVELSDTQKEAMDAMYKVYGTRWIEMLLNNNINELLKDLSKNVRIETLYALRRRINYTLELSNGSSGLVFSTNRRNGESIFSKIQSAIMNNKIVIIDTSMVGSEAERLLSSAIVRRLFYFFRRSKQDNPESFKLLPELLILFEEAPRVLGKEVLSHGSNVFEKIAREGRKFKVGLCAITQMPSLIPKEILSQMNTKVILGMPSPYDRNAVIESSAQNISDESVEIQMLDKGEAIITSPFIDFPIPVKIFNFNELEFNKKEKKVSFSGI